MRSLVIDEGDSELAKTPSLETTTVKPKDEELLMEMRPGPRGGGIIVATGWGIISRSLRGKLIKICKRRGQGPAVVAYWGGRG